MSVTKMCLAVACLFACGCAHKDQTADSNPSTATPKKMTASTMPAKPTAPAIRIDAGASLVGSHFFPGPPQDVGPDDAVIQSVESTAPIPLGRKVQSALELA